MIREPRAGDEAQICGIYNHYVANTIVTFGLDPVTEKEMAAEMAAISDKLPWLVWEDGGHVLGYAAASV